VSTETERPAPVYILGAGFSKAIHDDMPVTNELGTAIAKRLELGTNFLNEPGGFEAHLSNLLTRMPFLSAHQNLENRALALKILSAMADYLDQCENNATRQQAPLWLAQLVALWHAEKATVLTFNYDTLVERAVNSSLLIHEQHRSDSGPVYSGQIARPAPTLDEVTTYSSESPSTDQSFRLVKLHGSLNWYWSSSDPTSAVRVHSDEGFDVRGKLQPRRVDASMLLDRLVIPPVFSKDVYYSSNLNEQLWRTAGKAILGATQIYVLGYSIPREDRVVTELLKLRSHECPVTVTNLDPGKRDDPASVLGRLRSLGIPVLETWSGNAALPDFTSSHLQTARALEHGIPLLEKFPYADIIASVTDRPRFVARDYCIWQAEGRFRSEEVPNNADKSSSPPRELVHQNVAVTGANLDDFLNGGKLKALLDDGIRPEFDIADAVVSPVTVHEDEIGRSKVLRVVCAPLRN